jgi:hypothetical protein
MADIIALRRATPSRHPGGASAGVAEPVRAGDLTELVRVNGLAGLVRPASAEAGGPDEIGERILPVLPELRALLPAGGLRRGSTVAVTSTAGVHAGTAWLASTARPDDGTTSAGRPAPAGAVPASRPVRSGTAGRLMSFGATSVLLALLAAASAAGSWCAVVGMPALGLAAAAELGVALERLVLVPEPGPDWPAVVAALLDGIDVVAVAPPGPVSAALGSRLAARARQRGSVLVPYGQWSGADIVLRTPGGGWRGLGGGWGRLARRGLVISRRGRGAAAHPREVTLWLPLGTPPPAADAPPLEAVTVLEAVG